MNLSLEGKKRAQIGGLTTNLTVAENAFIRLTSNIDVTEGLANGVRGIIQKLVTNHEGSISVILVKFDDETVGEKAKVLSQYKEQYPDAVPIFRHGIPFQHKNVTIFHSQFPLIMHGQVLFIQCKDSQWTKLLLTSPKYLLQARHMWHRVG